MYDRMSIELHWDISGKGNNFFLKQEYNKPIQNMQDLLYYIKFTNIKPCTISINVS